MPTNLRKLTLSIEAVGIVPAWSPQYFLSVLLVADENKTELRGFLTLSIIIILSLIVTKAIVLRHCIA